MIRCNKTEVEIDGDVGVLLAEACTLVRGLSVALLREEEKGEVEEGSSVTFLMALLMGLSTVSNENEADEESACDMQIAIATMYDFLMKHKEEWLTDVDAWKWHEGDEGEV